MVLAATAPAVYMGLEATASPLGSEPFHAVELMPSLPLVAFLVLVCAASVGRAAESPAHAQGAELVVPSVADLDLDAAPARQAGALAPRGGAAGGQELDRSKPGERLASPLNLRLGRTPAVGRSPGDVPPLYGEVGIDLESGAGLSLAPSYRVVLSDDEAENSETGPDQIVKFDARIRF